jgi:hypothetical protein
LLEALFDFRGEDTVMKLESMISDKKSTPLQKVYSLIEYYVDKFMNQQCFHKVMSREQVTNQRGVTTTLILQLKKRNQALVEQLIHSGQKSGDFKKNIDIPLMMATLVGTVSHLVTTQHYYREINNLQNLSDDDVDKHIRKKLNNHLKFLFKAILTHEA